MKISVTINGQSYPARLPYSDAAFVVVDDLDTCPECGHKAPDALGVQRRLKVFGRNQRIESHDTYASDAHAVCCDGQVGTIRVKMSTIFGVEEDSRVLNGPWKVY